MEPILHTFLSFSEKPHPLIYIGLLLLLGYTGGQIANYFKAIVRRRVEVPKHNGRWPLLSVVVENNHPRADAGDNDSEFVANYVFIAGSRLEKGTHQDALIGQMVDAIDQAARDFKYSNQNGYSADVTVEPWHSDEATKSETGIVWVEFPVEVKYRPV